MLEGQGYGGVIQYYSNQVYFLFCDNNIAESCTYVQDFRDVQLKKTETFSLTNFYFVYAPN